MKTRIISRNFHEFTGRLTADAKITKGDNARISLAHNMGKDKDGNALVIYKDIFVTKNVAEKAAGLLKKGTAVKVTYFERPASKDGKTYVNLIARNVEAAQLREVADDAAEAEADATEE